MPEIKFDEEIRRYKEQYAQQLQDHKNPEQLSYQITQILSSECRQFPEDDEHHDTKEDIMIRTMGFLLATLSLASTMEEQNLFKIVISQLSTLDFLPQFEVLIQLMFHWKNPTVRDQNFQALIAHLVENEKNHQQIEIFIYLILNQENTPLRNEVLGMLINQAPISEDAKTLIADLYQGKVDSNFHEKLESFDEHPLALLWLLDVAKFYRRSNGKPLSYTGHQRRHFVDTEIIGYANGLWSQLTTQSLTQSSQDSSKAMASKMRPLLSLLYDEHQLATLMRPVVIATAKARQPASLIQQLYALSRQLPTGNLFESQLVIQYTLARINQPESSSTMPKVEEDQDSDDVFALWNQDAANQPRVPNLVAAFNQVIANQEENSQKNSNPSAVESYMHLELAVQQKKDKTIASFLDVYFFNNLVKGHKNEESPSSTLARQIMRFHSSKRSLALDLIAKLAHSNLRQIEDLTDPNNDQFARIAEPRHRIYDFFRSTFQCLFPPRPSQSPSPNRGINLTGSTTKRTFLKLVEARKQQIQSLDDHEAGMGVGRRM